MFFFNRERFHVWGGAVMRLGRDKNEAGDKAWDVADSGPGE